MARFGTDKTDGNHHAKASDIHTLLGRGSAFDGKLAFEGQVRIDGKFSGSISTDDTLVIGEGAQVNAEIVGGVVIVSGTVEGKIRATQLVQLHPPARVRGTIEAPNLTIDKGVVFEGTCSMEPFQTATPSPLATN